ncbi:MAG: hypothetical protein V4467_01915 [Patescibacteria group bacterium]
MKIIITLEMAVFVPFDQTTLGNHLEELKYQYSLSSSNGSFTVEVQMHNSDPNTYEFAKERGYVEGLVEGILRGRGRVITKQRVLWGVDPL